jgi:hypothetical protein
VSRPILGPDDRWLRRLADLEDAVKRLEHAARVPNVTRLAGGIQYGATTGATFQGTTSLSYTDLATVGPDAEVTVTDQGRVLVWLQAEFSTDGDFVGRVSFELIGPTPVGPHDDRSISGGFIETKAGFAVVAGLDPGTYTVRLKYRTDHHSAATSNYRRRRVIAFPL